MLSPKILTPDALDFVAKLERSFRDQREELLQRRIERQAAIDGGQMPDFLPETAHIRESDWTIAPAPASPAGPSRGDHRAG